MSHKWLKRQLVVELTTFDPIFIQIISDLSLFHLKIDYFLESYLK